MNFLQKDKFGVYTGVLYWVKSPAAQSVKEFSAFPMENEFLLLPGTTLKMLNRSRSVYHHGVYEVHMEETITPSTGLTACYTDSVFSFEKVLSTRSLSMLIFRNHKSNGTSGRQSQ
jgi:hypothetical protein